MTINGDVTRGVRGVSEREAAGPAGRTNVASPASASQMSAAAPRRDGVEMSAEGRALARGATLTPERIDEVRQRIIQGAYDQASVVEAVARRILHSGDL